MDPKEQSFDFTKEGNQEELQKWKKAIKAIPLKLSIDQSLFDKSGTEIEVSHEFLTTDEDTWFWLGFIFKAGNLVNIILQGNYRDGEEGILLPMVNSFFEKYGLPVRDDFSVCEIKSITWQEAYDLLCAIARETKIPPCSVK